MGVLYVALAAKELHPLAAYCHRLLGREQLGQGGQQAQQGGVGGGSFAGLLQALAGQQGKRASQCPAGRKGMGCLQAWQGAINRASPAALLLAWMSACWEGMPGGVEGWCVRV